MSTVHRNSSSTRCFHSSSKTTWKATSFWLNSSSSSSQGVCLPKASQISKMFCLYLVSSFFRCRPLVSRTGHVAVVGGVFCVLLRSDKVRVDLVLLPALHEVSGVYDIAVPPQELVLFVRHRATLSSSVFMSSLSTLSNKSLRAGASPLVSCSKSDIALGNANALRHFEAVPFWRKKQTFFSAISCLKTFSACVSFCSCRTFTSSSTMYTRLAAISGSGLCLRKPVDGFAATL